MSALGRRVKETSDKTLVRRDMEFSDKESNEKSAMGRRDKESSDKCAFGRGVKEASDKSALGMWTRNPVTS